MRALIIVVYLIISSWLFLTFKTSTTIFLSFFLSNFLIFSITCFHLYIEKEFSPFISTYVVFNYLFFIVAPISQLKVVGFRNGDFTTNLPYDSGDILLTNVLIILFNSMFIVSYFFFKARRTDVTKRKDVRGEQKRTPLVIVCLLLLSVVIALASLGFVINEISRANWMSKGVSTTAFLLWKKVLFLVPLAGVILCVSYYKKRNKWSKDHLYLGLIFIMLLALLLWFKNPLVEKRNALGPIYITLIYLFFPRLLNSNSKVTLFMFFSMVVVFPLSAIITHASSTLSEIIRKPRLLLDQFEGEGVSEVFNTIHYDAFINIAATIDYVKYEGFSYGEQLLSSLLFFVPRKLWFDKPISTGQLVGEHLIDKYDFTYSNLSNPMVSEGYINFGVVGVIFIAIALGYMLVYFLTWLRSDRLIRKMMAFYFAIHLLFFLRGDFANGFSYYIGTLVGVMGITWFVDYMIKNVLINQRKWKEKRSIRA